MRATSAWSASCVMGLPERNWPNSFSAMAAALRIFRTRSWYSASNSFPVSEFIGQLCAKRFVFFFPEIQVNDRLLTFLDNNEDAAVSVSLRPSYDGVSSTGQRHNLGNFIGWKT